MEGLQPSAAVAPPSLPPQAFACLVRLHEAVAAGAAGTAGPDAEQQPDLEAVEEYRWHMHLSRTDLPYAALQVGRGGWEGGREGCAAPGVRLRVVVAVDGKEWEGTGLLCLVV